MTQTKTKPISVETTTGDSILLDEEVANALEGYDIYSVRRGNDCSYSVGKKGSREKTSLATLILNMRVGEGTIHKNGDNRDYRRENLIIKTREDKAAEAGRSRKILQRISKKSMIEAYEGALQNNPKAVLGDKSVGEEAQKTICAEYGLISPLPLAFFSHGRRAIKMKYRVLGKRDRLLTWEALTDKKIETAGTKLLKTTIKPVVVRGRNTFIPSWPDKTPEQKINRIEWLQAFHDPDHAFHDIMVGNLTVEQALQRAVKDLKV